LKNKESKLLTRQEMKKKKFNDRDQMIGIGMIFGIVFGILIDNIGLGICLGIAIGAGMGSVQNKRKEKIED